MKESLKLALEALKENQHLVADNERHAYVMEYNSIIEKCEEALAQPEPSPEWMTEEEQTAYTFGWFKALESRRMAQPEHEPVACVNGCKGFFKYTTPPQRTWVGLTDEEILSWWSMDNGLEDLDMCSIVHFRKFVEEVEARLKRKNT